MPKIKILFVLFLLTFASYKLDAKIYIKYKIGDQIITNFDIENEINNLIFFRPSLEKLSKDELNKIAKNTLIREIIKNTEIKKAFTNINSIDLEKKVKQRLFAYKKVKNEDELIQILKKDNINYKEVVEKVKYETLWNELIFQKFNKSVKIDKDYLSKQLKVKIYKNRNFEYNLSEILFEVDNNENVIKKNDEILKSIKKYGFKASASKYSISNSASVGGNIGWVKETVLSNKIVNKLDKLDIGGITKPIKYPNGFLILIINEKKEIKKEINFDEELNEFIKFEKNKQLNQFSQLYYKRLKQNTIINAN
ncbi:peptidylprolyl isomerase [Candidatus Pelagibacter sp.]|nr:peptidylprolyl isomerase [Candidatus Pelagibacter sp.]